jgi:endonuclease/exonuclease/phosphatase family metal-dependent hydrolase
MMIFSPVFRTIAVFALCSSVLPAREYSLMVFNVENLFDLDGVAHFEEYRQSDVPFPYHAGRLLTKVRTCAEVIRAFDEGKGPDLIALQELEGDFTPDPTFSLEAALKRHEGESLESLLTLPIRPEIQGYPAEFFLMKALQEAGLRDYRFFGPVHDRAWAQRGIVHRCAFVSRLPLIEMRQHPLDDARDIVEALWEIEGAPLRVFNNHWKSGASSAGTEGVRVRQAGVLRGLVEARRRADPSEDIVLVGDFNSHHDQRLRFDRDKAPKTAIDEVLGSRASERGVVRTGRGFYNLWYELPGRDRGSEVYAGSWSTLMQVLLAPSLYDGKALQYVDQSFGVHRVGGVNACSESDWPLSWVNLGDGRGCSDHLPVYFRFRRLAANGEALPLRRLGDERPKVASPAPARLRLEEVALDQDPLRLEDMTEAQLLEQVGGTFLLEGLYQKPKLVLGGRAYGIYATTSDGWAALNRLATDRPVRFAGMFGIHRGELQFVVHGRDWVEPFQP